MRKYNEQEIEKLLSELPKVEDDRSFDFYFKNLSEKIEPKRKKSIFKTVWIPIITTAAVVFLAFLISMQFVNNQSTLKDRGDHDESAEHFLLEEASEDRGVEVEEEKQEVNQAGEAQTNDFDDVDSLNEVEVSTLNSKVIVFNDTISYEQDNMVTYYIPDNQLNTFIPITIRVELEERYESINFIEDRIDSTIGVHTEVFQAVNFAGFNEENQPIVEIDETIINSNYGSTMEGMLIDSIGYFFKDLGENDVILNSSNGGPVSLSHIGEISSINNILDGTKRFIYRIYQPADTVTKWFAMEYSYEDLSFEEAIERMKEEDRDFDLYPSIQPDFAFEVDTDDEDRFITITLSHSTTFGENEESVMAIEALMLTAKSFGYEQLIFENVPDRVGPYTLTKPLNLDGMFYVNPY